MYLELKYVCQMFAKKNTVFIKSFTMCMLYYTKKIPAGSQRLSEMIAFFVIFLYIPLLLLATKNKNAYFTYNA
jgi:hypothetical protein